MDCQLCVWQVLSGRDAAASAEPSLVPLHMLYTFYMLYTCFTHVLHMFYMFYMLNMLSTCSVKTHLTADSGEKHLPGPFTHANPVPIGLRGFFDAMRDTHKCIGSLGETNN